MQDSPANSLFITDEYRTVLYNKYKCGYLQDDTIPDPIYRVGQKNWIIFDR